jgi:hypothetical protein
MSSSEGDQNVRSLNEYADRYFNERDYRTFKWVFCRYICEVGKPVRGYELFLASNLNGYFGDEAAMKDFVLDNTQNLYYIFINRIMQCLIDKNFVVRRFERNGGSETPVYEATPYLNDFTKKFFNLCGSVDI